MTGVVEVVTVDACTHSAVRRECRVPVLGLLHPSVAVASLPRSPVWCFP